MRESAGEGRHVDNYTRHLFISLVGGAPQHIGGLLTFHNSGVVVWPQLAGAVGAA